MSLGIMVIMIITINRGEVTTSADFPPHSAVKVLSGSLWLTKDGCAEDIVLRSGAKMNFSSGHKLVFQALDGPASFELLPCRL